MAITGVNNNTLYTNYYADTKQKSSLEPAKNEANQQAAGKTYSSAREYGAYLAEKYECLKSPEYSVAINSSLLSKALGDEKTSEWLEYNLSLIPENVEKMKSAAEACGSKIISCNISFNGYDDITTEMVGRFEADPATEKTRERLKEKIKKIREEKKAEEKRTEENRKEEERIEKSVYGSDVAIIDYTAKGHRFEQKI